MFSTIRKFFGGRADSAVDSPSQLRPAAPALRAAAPRPGRPEPAARPVTVPANAPTAVTIPLKPIVDHLRPTSSSASGRRNSATPPSRFQCRKFCPKLATARSKYPLPNSVTLPRREFSPATRTATAIPSKFPCRRFCPAWIMRCSRAAPPKNKFPFPPKSPAPSAASHKSSFPPPLSSPSRPPNRRRAPRHPRPLQPPRRPSSLRRPPHLRHPRP